MVERAEYFPFTPVTDCHFEFPTENKEPDSVEIRSIGFNVAKLFNGVSMT